MKNMNKLILVLVSILIIISVIFVVSAKKDKVFFDSANSASDVFSRNLLASFSADEKEQVNRAIQQKDPVGVLFERAKTIEVK